MTAAVFGATLGLAGGVIPAFAITANTTPSLTQGKTGYDVSWPQCSTSNTSGVSYTSPGNFAIIGANDGKAYTPNPCIPAEVTAAAGIPISFYQNTGDPGPRSSHWPAGVTIYGTPTTTTSGSVTCPAQKRYANGSKALSDCSYVYGWQAAAVGYSYVPAADLTPPTQWWLDVESANSWLSDKGANTRDIQGAVDYLSSQVTASNVGIYTNSSSWSSITGGDNKTFAGYPWWAPGYASSTQDAPSFCTTTSITGGHLRYLQWVDSAVNLDKDYDCG